MPVQPENSQPSRPMHRDTLSMSCYSPFTTFQKTLEPLVRIELTTSSLPRKCSTPELQRHYSVSTAGYKLKMSGRRGSNSPPIAWKAIALPNELLPHRLPKHSPGLPYNHKELLTVLPAFSASWRIRRAQCSGQERIRTSEVERQRIYSPPHLAALEPALPGNENRNYKYQHQPVTRLYYLYFLSRICPEPLVGIEPTTY
jgi:hypothetical protein